MLQSVLTLSAEVKIRQNDPTQCRQLLTNLRDVVTQVWRGVARLALPSHGRPGCDRGLGTGLCSCQATLGARHRRQGPPRSLPVRGECVRGRLQALPAQPPALVGGDRGGGGARGGRPSSRWWWGRARTRWSARGPWWRHAGFSPAEAVSAETGGSTMVTVESTTLQVWVSRTPSPEGARRHWSGGLPLFALSAIKHREIEAQGMRRARVEAELGAVVGGSGGGQWWEARQTYFSSPYSVVGDHRILPSRYRDRD